MRTVLIKKLRACSQGICIYLNEYGAVRIKTNHYRCEMRPEEFLTLLRKSSATINLNPKEIFMKTETIKSVLLNLLAPAILLLLLAFDTQAQSEKPALRQADPAAWNLLKAARETREVLPNNIKHISAQLILNDDGAIKTGTVSYDGQNRAVIKLDGLSDEAKAWVDDQVNSVLAHRRNGDFSKGDGRHPITFAANDHKSPLGRRIELHDSMKSSYRIKNNQVVEVDRTMADDHFVITVLETTPTAKGKFLPRNFW